MFYPTELVSKDLSVYKDSKEYSYYKSGWLQPLPNRDLSGSKFSSEENVENISQ